MCKPPSTNALQALPNPGNDLRAFYHFISIVLWRRIAATTLLAVCLVLSSLLAADRPLESAAFTVEDDRKADLRRREAKDRRLALQCQPVVPPSEGLQDGHAATPSSPSAGTSITPSTMRARKNRSSIPAA